MLVTLAQHHDAAHSYYVLFDRTAAHGHPGMPQYIALHLQLDAVRRTFCFERERCPCPRGHGPG